MRKLWHNLPASLGLFLVALAAIGVISYALTSRPKLPVYQGQTLYEWAARYQKAAYLSGSPGHLQELEACQKAIRAMGTNAIPFALEDVKAPNNPTFLGLEPHERWERGIITLECLGSIANSCLPDLVAYADKNPGYSEAALLAVGPAALPAFTNLLMNSKSLQTTIQLIGVLEAGVFSGRIAPEEATVAVPCLVQIYHSKDPRERRMALSGLNVICAGSLGLLTDDAINRQVSKMRTVKIAGPSEPIDSNQVLAMVLGMDMGHDSVEAIPILIQEVQDKHPSVRLYAAIGLGQFSNLPEQSIPALEKALFDPDNYVRMMSAESLGRFGLRATNAIPALERARSDADSSVTAAATQALQLIRNGKSGGPP